MFPEAKLHELRGVDVALYCRFMRGCCALNVLVSNIIIALTKQIVHSLVLTPAHVYNYGYTVTHPSQILIQSLRDTLHEPCTNFIARWLSQRP